MDSNTRNTELDTLENAKKIASENLPECCRELLEWRATNVLPDGYVRLMAKTLNNAEQHQSLTIAKYIVERMALESVSKNQADEQTGRIQMFQD